MYIYKRQFKCSSLSLTNKFGQRSNRCHFVSCLFRLWVMLLCSWIKAIIFEKICFHNWVTTPLSSKLKLTEEKTRLSFLWKSCFMMRTLRPWKYRNTKTPPRIHKWTATYPFKHEQSDTHTFCGCCTTQRLFRGNSFENETEWKNRR